MIAEIALPHLADVPTRAPAKLEHRALHNLERLVLRKGTRAIVFGAIVNRLLHDVNPLARKARLVFSAVPEFDWEAAALQRPAHIVARENA